MTIPLFDISLDNQIIKKSFFQQLSDLYDKGQFTVGHGIGPVDDLEKLWAQYCNRKYAIGVGSGTHALQAASYALNLKSGDEVIVPANTFIATALAPALSGATIVSCDVDPETWNLSKKTVSNVISKNTKAIFSVNLYGNPAPYDDLRSFGIPIVEDAAHSHGALYKKNKISGSLGDYSTFSFFPTKVFGGIGDSGMILFDDEEKIDILKAFRNCGQSKPHYASELGSVYRMHVVQALFLLEKWKIFESILEHRRKLATIYNEIFLRTPVIPQKVEDENVSSYFAYVVRVQRRENIIELLMKKGIQTSIQYRYLLDEQDVWRKISTRSTATPVAKSLSSEIISLPMNSKVTEEDVREVASILLDNI